MPQVVKAQVRQAPVPQQASKRRPQAGRVDRPSRGVAEDEVAIVPGVARLQARLQLARTVPLEYIEQQRREGNLSPARRRFRLALNQSAAGKAAHGPADLERALLEVNIAPMQGQQFPLSHPGQDGKGE